ncbi:hypothetical protein [Sphingopyxis sp. DBS4]|uniref:hypothetical protein n=1 Tax=Sphingopyxis sp. DBS4 TaxID=2968500 RepID=UPI00214D04BE|nr:hypothetical protein [Sphingopyxis sp. DBS4]
MVLAGSGTANAQGWLFKGDITPNREIVDGRGVDVQFGEISVATEPVGVGDLSSAASWSGITDFSKFRAYVAGGTSGDRYVFLHGKTIKFLSSGGVYVPADGDGSTLVKSTSALEAYTYTDPDGAIYYFQRVNADDQRMSGAMNIRGYLMTVSRPDGRKLEYAYKGVEDAEVCGHTCYYPYMVRVQAIVSSDGYMLNGLPAMTGPVA